MPMSENSYNSGRAPDPFRDSQNRPRVVHGVTIVSGAPRLAELAGRIGFDTVWIEVEHGPISFSEVEALCIAAEAGGAIPTVRLPDTQRHHILRSLEAGARILVVAMVNDAETAREIVRHGKYPPLGKRGFYTRSRGVNYGLDDPATAFQQANERTHLFVQIETMEAVQNLDEICSVEGLAGIFIGPGDLSASMGRLGAFADPEMIALVVDCVKRARDAGKHCGILTTPGPLLEAVMKAGCDLIFSGGDLSDLTKAWRSLLTSMHQQETG